MAKRERKNRFYDTSRFSVPEIRVFRRKKSGKTAPRLLLKCGCCDRKVEVYYGGGALEINGVHGAVADWREILLPLLRRTKVG